LLVGDVLDLLVWCSSIRLAALEETNFNSGCVAPMNNMETVTGCLVWIYNAFVIGATFGILWSDGYFGRLAKRIKNQFQPCGGNRT